MKIILAVLIGAILMRKHGILEKGLVALAVYIVLRMIF